MIKMNKIKLKILIYGIIIGIISKLVLAENATGWNELYSGNMISAAYTMYNVAFANWFVAILFFVYQFMLFMKTRNATLCWVTGLFFAALYAVSVFVKSISIQAIFLLLVFELAGILYMLLWKR